MVVRLVGRLIVWLPPHPAPEGAWIINFRWWFDDYAEEFVFEISTTYPTSVVPSYGCVRLGPGSSALCKAEQ